MQCQAITQIGTPCKRLANTGSNYCWQHTLMGQALQPDIMTQISLFSGNPITNFTNALPNTINQRKILGNWFAEIKVKTSIDDIDQKDIPLLWTLYQKRIDNAPAKDLLKKAISQGLDPYIFKSKTFYYHDTIPDLPEDARDFYDYGDYLTKYLQDFITNNKIRQGDLVRITQYDFNNELIYTGEFLEDLAYYGSPSAYLPDDIKINNYPTTNYFDLLNEPHQGYYIDVNFDTDDTKIQLLGQYELGGEIIYEYQTIGKYKNYRILTTNPNFKFEDTLKLYFNLKILLDQTGQKYRISYGEIQIQDIDSKYRGIFDKLLNDQSLRILYDDYREVDKSDRSNEYNRGDYNDN